MSTSYPFYIDDPTDIATKTSLLTARLNNDPDIAPSTLPVTSTVYSAPTLTVTFPQALSTYGNYILQWTFNAIFNLQTAGQTYNYQNQVQNNVRSVINSTTVPSIISDIYAGYNVGSIVYDRTNNRIHVCVDSTAGAAKWITMSAFLSFDTPLIFSTGYNSSNSVDYVSTNSIVFFTISRFVFSGTNVHGALISLTCLVSLSSANSMEVMLRDRTNGNNVISILPWVNTGGDNVDNPFDLNTRIFANVPTGRAVFEVSFRRVTGGTARVHSIQLR